MELLLRIWRPSCDRYQGDHTVGFKVRVTIIIRVRVREGVTVRSRVLLGIGVALQLKA